MRPAACHGFDQVVRIEVEFSVDVSRQSVVRGQFLGDLGSRLRREPLAVYSAVSSAYSAVGIWRNSRRSFATRADLAVPLARHGDVLAQRHRHGSGYETSQTGGEDWAARGGGTGNTNDDASHRDDAVVGAQAHSHATSSIVLIGRRCAARSNESVRCLLPRQLGGAWAKPPGPGAHHRPCFTSQPQCRTPRQQAKAHQRQSAVKGLCGGIRW